MDEGHSTASVWTTVEEPPPQVRKSAIERLRTEVPSAGISSAISINRISSIKSIILRCRHAFNKLVKPLIGCDSII